MLDHGGIVRASRVRAEPGRAVSVGIRPEHLRACDAAQAFVTGTVEMVEQLGADTLVHIDHGKVPIIARMPQGAQPDVGSPFSVDADPARVFLFDTATGARLR